MCLSEFLIDIDIKYFAVYFDNKEMRNSDTQLFLTLLLTMAVEKLY